MIFHARCLRKKRPNKYQKRIVNGCCYCEEADKAAGNFLLENEKKVKSIQELYDKWSRVIWQTAVIIWCHKAFSCLNWNMKDFLYLFQKWNDSEINKENILFDPYINFIICSYVISALVYYLFLFTLFTFILYNFFYF